MLFGWKLWQILVDHKLHN